MSMLHRNRFRLRSRKFKLYSRVAIMTYTLIFVIALFIMSVMYISLQSRLNATKGIEDDDSDFFMSRITKKETRYKTPENDDDDDDQESLRTNSTITRNNTSNSTSRVTESELVPLSPFIVHTPQADKNHISSLHNLSNATWINAESQVIHTFNADVNVEMLNPFIHFRDRFDHTKSEVEQRRADLYNVAPLHSFEGNEYVKWKEMYNPLDKYRMPVFATIKEQNTLNHASIFISIAAFRDSECAPTLESALRQARTPHRIYAGISEERLASDADCLKQLHLHEPALARKLLWGEGAPESLSFELRNLTWKEIMHDRGVIATSADDMIENNSHTSSSIPSSTSSFSSSEQSNETVNHQLSFPADNPVNKHEVTTKVFLDPSYTTETITCVAGNLETQRDRFLLSQLTNSSHNKENSMSNSVYARFRRGRGGVQEQVSPALAGCRVTRRITDPSNARGPTFGRYMTSLFYFNQDYYMMVDSHSRFSLHWDTKMITRVFQMPTRGILSHYPNGYTPEKPEEEFVKKDTMTMCKGVILANGMPKLGANWVQNKPQPMLEAFAAAGYTFGDAAHVLQVPFDPFLHYMFDGEEILYSARLWTTGFDLYGPGEANVFHYYGRANAPKYWSYLTGERPAIMKRSERRALYLLHRAWPWAQIKEEVRKYTKQGETGTETVKLLRYTPPERRLIVDEQTAQHEWPLNILKEYYGAGKIRTLEQYWNFTELTDEFVTKRDAEKRWEGGQGLCKNL